MRLRGKVAAVTGGTRGLGRRIAESMLTEGARVVCAARSSGEFELIREVGHDRVAYHATDVCDRDSVDDLMKSTVDRFGKLDILVCNAGMSNDGQVRDISPEKWTEVIETNLIGTFHCVQAVIPYMSHSGRIITISSALSTRVSPGASAYSASKAAVEMFTKACAAELAGSGVTVNSVAPGFVDEGLGARLATNDLVWDDYRDRMLSGRLGRGDEIGSAVVFLASDDGAYVNSHVLEVNGGLMWN